MHTYNTYRVFTPIFLLTFLFLYRRDIFNGSDLKGSAAPPRPWWGRWDLLASGAILLASSALVAYQIYNHTGTARYGKLSILSENAVYNIGQSRVNSKLPPIISRLVYNRPVYFASTAATNYVNYFSPQFFYQTTGAQDQFAIPYKNLFGLPTLVMAGIGLLFIVGNLRSTSHRLILFWILTSPIAASLTADPPQALRPTPMIVSVIILAAIGLIWISRFLSDSLKISKLYPVFVIYFLSICAVAFGRYLTEYFNNYTKNYSFAWQYGYSQAIKYLSEHAAEYDRAFITKGYGEPHIFYAFYTQLDPQILQSSQHTIRFAQSDWYWTDRIDNVYFVNDWQIPAGEVANSLKLESGGDIPTQGALLITTPGHLPSNATPIKTIDFLDGELGFVIAKFK